MQSEVQNIQKHKKTESERHTQTDRHIQTEETTVIDNKKGLTPKPISSTQFKHQFIGFNGNSYNQLLHT